MKVSDILHMEGNTLYTVAPEAKLQVAMQTMMERGADSLVVAEYSKPIGMLTFREIIKVVAKNHGFVGDGTTVRKMMDDHLVTHTPETEVNEVRRIMLEYRVRYLPVLGGHTLMGTISFYDVIKTMLEDQSSENKMPRVYIRDWPKKKTNED